MTSASDRVAMLVGLDAGSGGRLERDGEPLRSDDLRLVSACTSDDFEAALELVESLIEAAAARLQPGGFATSYERVAFAAGLDSGRTADIATLQARRELLRRLRDGS